MERKSDAGTLKPDGELGRGGDGVKGRLGDAVEKQMIGHQLPVTGK